MTAKETQSLRKSPSHERPESPFNRGQWDKNESDAVHMKCISNVAESREASSTAAVRVKIAVTVRYE